MLATKNNEEFLLHSRKEVLALLRGIKSSHALVTAHFDHGKESFITTILDVLEERNMLILDYGVNEALNRKMLQSDRVIFVTSHNKVKVQFSSSDLKKVKYDKMDAFKMDIPDSVLRLQRREYFRIDTPIINPLHCIIPTFYEEGGEEMAFAVGDSFLSATIVNISVGGVGIVDFPAGANVKPGIIFRACQITLPGVGTLEVDMEVVNVYEISAKTGEKVMRYGCQFIDVNGSMQSMVQRYIIQLERERRSGPL